MFDSFCPCHVSGVLPFNESFYIEVNGQQQWLSIYGEDKNNPVLLYLHGGPGDSSSLFDYRILRKLANDYTVVNWDQRDAGKTWIHDPKDTAITSDLLRDNALFEKHAADFTIKNKTDYQMPVYILAGKYDDYNIGGIMKNYYDSITAPDKDFRYVEGGHIAAMLHPEELAQFVHENR